MSQSITDLSNYWLILLNVNIPDNQDIKRLWDNAIKIVCLDGAVNKLKRHIEAINLDLKRGPDYIIGDFDSIEPASLEWLKEKFGKDSHEIYELKCQNTTDFDKCLSFINKSAGPSESIVVFNSFGGRLDHSLACLHSASKYPQFQIHFMNESCLATIVTGSSKFSIKFKDFLDKSCGILPLFGPVTLSTRGLKWNLNRCKLQFTEFISTSNKIVEDEVFIENHSENAFIWTHSL